MPNVKQTLRARISSTVYIWRYPRFCSWWWVAVVGNPYRNPTIGGHDRTDKSRLAQTWGVGYFRTKNENRKSGIDSRSQMLITSKLNIKTQYQCIFWHTCISYERVCSFVTATPHAHLMTYLRSRLLGQAACEGEPFGFATNTINLAAVL